MNEVFTLGDARLMPRVQAPGIVSVGLSRPRRGERPEAVVRPLPAIHNVNERNP
jgi:hypothetical protein